MEKELLGGSNIVLEKILLSVSRWGAYLALFAPLVIHPSFFFMFVAPKTIYFRILVEIIFASYFVLALFFPKYRPRMNILSASILLFIVILTLSSFLGVDFQRSFWSTFERMTGLFTYLHLYAFFIVLSNVFRDKKDWEKILMISVFVGILISFTTLINESSFRKGGTLGNSSFLATYLLFDIFFAIILLVKNKFSIKGIFSIISLLILITTLLKSTAIGATLSFFGGLGLLGLGWLFVLGKRKIKTIGIFIFIGMIILGCSLIIFSPTIRNAIVHRLSDMKARFLVWEIAWKGFLEKPILGWGLENFNVVFAKFFNPKLFLKKYGGEVWFDRSHNIILDTLISSGIVGLISYLSIFVIVIFQLLKVCFKKEDAIKTISSLIMISLASAYFVQNLLVFDMISSLILFFLSLAFINFLINENQPSETMPCFVPHYSLIKKTTCFLVFTFIGLSLYFGNIQPAYSAINMVQMIKSEDFSERLDLYKKSINTIVYNREINEYFAPVVLSKNFQEEQQKTIVLLESKMQQNVENNSLDFRSYLNLSKFYINYYEKTKENNKLKLAESVLKKAIWLCPTNQQGYWLLSDVKLKQEGFGANIDLLQKAIDLEPKLNISHWYLAVAYKLNNQYEKALKEIKIAENLGYNWREKLIDFQIVIHTYESLKQYSMVVSLCKELLAVYPNDADSWVELSIGFFNLGKKDEAKQAIEKALEINPALISQIGDLVEILSQ